VARKEIARANAAAAAANERTEKLRAANLDLQKIIMPRRFGIANPAYSENNLYEMHVSLKRFGEIHALIQVIMDMEARVLANDIVVHLRGRGWQAEFTDELTVSNPMQLIAEGVAVHTRKVPKDSSSTPALKTAKEAGDALAALFNAEKLGQGPFAVVNWDDIAGPDAPQSTLGRGLPEGIVIITVGMRPTTIPLRMMEK
jgi:hypothetical protein